MTEAVFYSWVTYGFLGLAGLTFLALLFINAPYGRYLRKGWGPELPFLYGWILMEIASPAGMILWFLLGTRHTQIVPLVFLAMWLLHYLNRTFIYAYKRRERGRAIPLSIAAMGLLFNLGNSYLNGRYLFSFGPTYSASWLYDPRFLLGTGLFLTGWGLNLQADKILFDLRKPGETGYKIPQGGLYRWISCPNYFAEILEWIGWAIATWSLPGLVFAVWTAANLAPRAFSHHKWYQETFPEYPKQRKALIPFVL